ncbi:hypothetical protein BCR33DRAFT_713805, partial [Rhizoclosmatium globosum]
SLPMLQLSYTTGPYSTTTSPNESEAALSFFPSPPVEIRSDSLEDNIISDILLSSPTSDPTLDFASDLMEMLPPLLLPPPQPIPVSAKGILSQFQVGPVNERNKADEFMAFMRTQKRPLKRKPATIQLNDKPRLRDLLVFERKETLKTSSIYRAPYTPPYNSQD